MREIKFRAWDKERNGMFDVDWIDFQTGGIGLGHPEPTYSQDVESCVLMQFTGLKDKNGKEIYEGDVVSDGRNREVKWTDSVSCGCCNEASGYLWSIWEAARIEVIGNIYENPELLNQ